jgi:site-specific recombinase XerD
MLIGMPRFPARPDAAGAPVGPITTTVDPPPTGPHPPRTAPAPAGAAGATAGTVVPAPGSAPVADPRAGGELAALASAVAALPGLPADDPTDRYGVRPLTATWLAGFAPHTRTAYFRDLAHFLAWCQRQRLDPLRARPADLQQYRLACEHPDGGPGAGPATVHRRLSALSSWYRQLAAGGAGGDPGNPVAGVRRPRVDRDASTTVGLTAEQVRSLLAGADARLQRADRLLRQVDTPHRQRLRLVALRDRALLRLLADLGLRVGEALALDVDSLTHNRGRRTVRYRAKGGRWRERPLTAGALAAIEEYLGARARLASRPVEELTGALFATTGRGGVPGRLDEPAAFRLVRRLARQVGLPSAGRLSPHSLRHAFATNARELGVALEDVQDAMGHADTRTTRRYDRGRFALDRDPALRLGDLYGPASGD